MKKILIQTAAIIIVIFALTYLTGSFISASFSVQDWSYSTREMLGIFAFAFSVIISALNILAGGIDLYD